MAAILHSNMETDLRLAAMIGREIRSLLTDMASLRNTAGVEYLGDVSGSGSDTMRVRLAGLDGYDSFSATAAENTDVSNTSLTDSSVDVAVVRAALRYDLGDLARLTGLGNDIDPFRLAASMVGSFEQYFNAILAALFPSVTNSVGSTGVDFTVANFFSAVGTLEANSVPGPYYAVLYPQVLADLQSSLRSESGPAEHISASQDLINVKGPGFAGNFLGVDLYTSSDVESVNAGADSSSCMWGAGAFGYATGSPAPAMGGTDELRPAGSPIVVEITRDASSAITEIVGNAFCGVQIIENSRAVEIITDR